MTNNTSLTEQAKNKLMAAMLKDISPLAYQACEDVVKPMVTDIDKLPVICGLISEVKEQTNENMAFYCAVILRLYSPGHLYLTGLRLPNGLRDRFIEHFGYNVAPMWNHWAGPVRSMMKNSRFANAVNMCAIDIAKHLKNSGQFQGNIPFCAPSAQPLENIEKMDRADALLSSALDGPNKAANNDQNTTFDPDNG